jgi:cephalosporin hydroxylase
VTLSSPQEGSETCSSAGVLCRSAFRRSERSVAYRSMSSPTNGELVVMKTRDMIEQYEALIADLKPRRVVEIGMYGGGGAALLTQLADPVTGCVASWCRATASIRPTRPG